MADNIRFTPITRTLGAEETVYIGGPADSLLLLSATNLDTVQVQLTQGGTFFQLVAGITFNNLGIRDGFYLKSTSAANTITILTSDANVRDNRVTLTSTTVIPMSLAAGSVVAGAYLTGAIVDLGAKADAAATTDSGTFSLIALFKRLLGKFGDLTSSVANLNTGAGTNKTAIKASAGRVKSVTIFNASAAKIYVRFYNVASGSVIVGTTVATRVYAVAAGETGVATYDGGGDPYDTAITMAVTGGAAATDSTAVAAGDAQISVQFQ